MKSNLNIAEVLEDNVLCVEPINYNIISSGSKGNCVIIENIMFDCGVPFANIKEHLYNIKYLLITHIHTDHVNKSTYNRIRKEFPHIQVIANYEVHQEHEVDIISNHDYPVITKDYTFIPFELKHDVLCQGYSFVINGQAIIYATDTNNLDNAIIDKYDYLFLESNHDIKKLNAVRGRNGKRYGYNVYVNGLRHLSTQKCMEFYYLNRRSRDSVLVELHKSSRFY